MLTRRAIIKGTCFCVLLLYCDVRLVISFLLSLFILELGDGQRFLWRFFYMQWGLIMQGLLHQWLRNSEIFVAVIGRLKSVLGFAE